MSLLLIHKQGNSPAGNVKERHDMTYQTATIKVLKESALLIKDEITTEHNFAMEKLLDTLEYRMTENEFITFCEEL